MLQHIDMGAVMRRLAERKIEQAMEEGKFANLEGAGKPLELEPMPADENARLLWWAIRILRKNEVIPDEVRYRKAIDLLRRNVATAKDEASLRAAVLQANELIVKLNTMGTNVIRSEVSPLNVEHELARWREAQRERSGGDARRSGGADDAR